MPIPYYMRYVLYNLRYVQCSPSSMSAGYWEFYRGDEKLNEIYSIPMYQFVGSYGDWRGSPTMCVCTTWPPKESEQDCKRCRHCSHATVPARDRIRYIFRIRSIQMHLRLNHSVGLATLLLFYLMYFLNFCNKRIDWYVKTWIGCEYGLNSIEVYHLLKSHSDIETSLEFYVIPISFLMAANCFFLILGMFRSLPRHTLLNTLQCIRLYAEC